VGDFAKDFGGVESANGVVGVAELLQRITGRDGQDVEADFSY
jgi:hypothetical protein